MLGFKTTTKRFSLYYLEENEIYTQDMSAYVKFQDNKTKDKKEEKGKLHICSRSILFESEKPDTPIQKYIFRYFVEDPILANSQKIILRLTRIQEIVTQGPPAPYINYEEKDKQFLIEITPLYENVEIGFQWINKLYQISKNMNPGFDPEKDLSAIQNARQSQQKFDMSQVSISEKPIVDKPPLNIRCILPLISIPGFMYPTNKALYFQSKQNSSSFNQQLEIENIQAIYQRRYELQNIGLEIFVNGEADSYYFAFENEHQRNQLYKAVRDRIRSDTLNQLSLDNSLEQWQSRQITNYEYLMRLNKAGNRSFSDLSQYPIFPWVIKDYESDQIDLTDSKYFRDLTKPIGALDEKRLQGFKERYEDMPHPKFLYGTHYSTPGYVIGYLVRKYPQYMLKLQSGKFDKPDRLFQSIQGDWNNVMTNNASVKELIPEFYQEDESFLLNQQNLNLGKTQSEQKVDHVNLPKWAINAQDFLKTNREALESDIVSNNLHHWIDLIFGYKQRGPSSVEANNVFHPYTYEGAIDLDKISDPQERQSRRCFINEFGQCPKQLFKIPHPSRNYQSQSNRNNLNKSQNLDFNNNKEEQKNEQQEKKLDSQNIDYLDMVDQKVQTLWDFQNIEYKSLPTHKQCINQIIQLKQDNNKVISIGQDGSLKLIDLKQMNIQKSFKICSFLLSSITPVKDDELFAVGCWDSKVYIFNYIYGSVVQTLAEHTDAVSAVLAFKKRQILFTASWDCSIKKFPIVENGVEEDAEDFIDHQNQITALATNSNEDILAFGDVEGQICVYNIDSEEQVFSFDLDEQKVVKLLISNANLIALGDNIIKFYELTGTEISSFQIEEYNGQFTGVEIEGNTIIASTNKGNVSVYDLLQDKKIGHFFNDYKQSYDEIVQEDMQFTTLFLSEFMPISILGSQNGSLHFIQKQEQQE